MANSENRNRNRHIRRTAGATGAILAGAELMSALTGSAAVANVDNRPSAIVIEGKMPSLNSPTTLFQREVGVSVAAIEREYVQPIAVESVEQAASLFGGDAYSKDKENWFINEYGGATLKPDQSNKVHRVRANGAVVEAWIKINKPGEHQAQTLVARPRDTKKLDINAGTFWRAPQGQELNLWRQVREQVKEREAKEQSDVDVVPVCLPGEDPNRSVTPARIKSRVKAAQTWGRKGDKWSSNPNNWKLNRDGSATLREDPSGLEHEVRTNGAVLTGWNKIDRVSGFDASPFVASQVRELYAKGITVYLPKDGDAIALHHQLYKQTVKRERKQQPGTIVNSYCN